MNASGRFIQLDGIDGAGKSTLLLTARQWAEQHGLKIFDVIDWSKREKRLPTFEELGDADLLFTAEPTHAGIGDMIRNEIIRENAPYNAWYAAHAFALDRGVQYKRLILPFLASRPDCWIIQDRGLLSSLAYQPLQAEMETAADHIDVTIDMLLSLPGNQIELTHVPDVFVFVDINPEIAQQRLAARTDKQDHDRYSNADFQIKLASRYRLEEVTGPYTSRGTKIEIINGDKTKEEVAGEMRRILESIT